MNFPRPKRPRQNTGIISTRCPALSARRGFFANIDLGLRALRCAPGCHIPGFQPGNPRHSSFHDRLGLSKQESTQPDPGRDLRGEFEADFSLTRTGALKPCHGFFRVPQSLMRHRQEAGQTSGFVLDLDRLGQGSEGVLKASLARAEGPERAMEAASPRAVPNSAAESKT